MVYIFFVFGAMITVIYYLPLWFQAIKAVSATQSGIRTLPLVLSLVVGSIFAGTMTTKFGCYNPFLIACSVLMSIGAGLLMTLKVDSSEGEWIGYQILFGFGLGLGMQSPMIAVQAALPKKDIAVGVSLLFVTMNLGGAVLTCVAQTLFDNDLRKGVEKIAGVDPLAILRSGATDLRRIVPTSQLLDVLKAYDHALTRTFVVALVIAALSLVAAVGIPWINVKGLKEGGEVGIQKRENERVEKEMKDVSSN
jgi:energy-converting hydrogenase Eha subunit E